MDGWPVPGAEVRDELPRVLPLEKTITALRPG